MKAHPASPSMPASLADPAEPLPGDAPGRAADDRSARGYLAATLGGWPQAVALGLAYAAAAWGSLYLSRLPGEIAHVWYANALAMAVLVRMEPTRWPLPLAAVATAVVGVNMAWGDAAHTALGFITPNLVEIALAAALLRHVGLHRDATTSVGTMLKLMLLGAVVPQAVGALLGAALLSGRGAGSFWSIWQTWLEGATLGALSVLPFAHAATRLGPRALARIVVRWGSLSMAALSVGVTLLALAHVPFPFVYLTVPLMMAAAVSGLELVAGLTLMVSVTVAVSLATGVFVPPPLTLPWQEVYIYMAWATALVPALLLAAAVADLRASRERLAERGRELAHANQGLEQFVRILSHDLREPLNTVTQFAGLIRADHAERLPPDAQTYLGLVERAGQRMRALLDDLLSYTRWTRRPANEALQDVALDQVVADALQSLAARLRESQARVDVGDLPRVRGHAAALALLFQNLVGNAVKFVPPGRTPEVRVQAETLHGRVLVRVSDNGIGIAPADQARLFQPFVRLNLRQQYEGTGLGLALVQQIAEGHGGTVRIESEAGRGATFVVDLPAPGA